MIVRKSLRPLAAALCIAAVSAGSSGCFGKFAAFNKLRNWNEGVGNKWVNWAVFLGLTIIPVYPLAWIGDVLIFNSVEFWTGSNPFAMKDGEVREKLAMLDGHLVRMRVSERGARLTVEVDGQLAFEVVASEKGAVMLDAQARELARAEELEGGAVRITDGGGQRVVPAGQMEQLAAAAKQGRAAFAAARDQARGFQVATR